MPAFHLLKKLLPVTAGLFCIALSAAFIVDKDSFLADQKANSRVKLAYTEKQAILVDKLKKQGFDIDHINILITAFKTEQQLNIYIKKPAETKYRKFATYDICSSSGMLGPKRRSGDGQVPEGFYYIDRFNPQSTYFLSLGLNYPNQADKIRCGKADPGGDIFIHGKCVTIGCMPMTDDYIKEIYILAIQARQSGQLKVPVYVFPSKFDSVNAANFAKPYANDKQTLKFWDGLKKGYQGFNSNLQELKVGVNKSGEYVL